jgi:hypothetical protein
MLSGNQRAWCVEPADNKELVRAREALRRELDTLYFVSGRWSAAGGPLPIIGKLRSLLGEIDELLEGEEPDAPLPKVAALREGALLYEIHGEPLSPQRTERR